MKYSLLFIVGIAFFSCQPHEENNIRGSGPTVKSLLESAHDPVGPLDGLEYDPEVSEDSYISELLFNAKGQLQKESKFDSKGNLKSKAVHKYDKRGNAVHVDIYTSNGLSSTTITSRFDSSNKLIERNEVDAQNHLLSRQAAELNSDGNRVVMTYKRSSGSLVKTLECIFDTRRRNILNNYFTKEALKNKEINTFDPNGNRTNAGYRVLSEDTVIEVESAFQKDLGAIGAYESSRSIRRREINVYDAAGNKIETVQHFPLVNKRTITRYRYFKNRTEEAILSGNLIVVSRKIIRYDDQHNITEILRYGIGGRLEEHQRHLYGYDQTGNWTKHKTIINNKSISVVIRQFEYF